MVGCRPVFRPVRLPDYRHSAGYQDEPALFREFLWPPGAPDSSTLFSLHRGDGLLLSRPRTLFPVEPGIPGESGQLGWRRRAAWGRCVLVTSCGRAFLSDVAVAGSPAEPARARVDLRLYYNHRTYPACALRSPWHGCL